MEHLIINLIGHLSKRKFQEIKNIEKYKQNDAKELILITSGKIMELDNIIQNLNEMITYETHLKSKQK
jgi:hypothetical protein